jgi:hypothetical protein
MLDVVREYVYLGYLLHKRGTWRPHVSMRTKKGLKWDAIAARMVGKLGGCTVEVAAEVRAATAETSVLYAGEFWGGAESKKNEAVDRHQAKVAKRVLGVRPSAEAAGVLCELGWTATSVKARRRRLGLWWRVQASASRLMKKIAEQAEPTRRSIGEWWTRRGKQRRSEYNWFRDTETEVAWLEQETGQAREELAKMSKAQFKEAVARATWREEWSRRVAKMKQSARLSSYATRLETEQARDPQAHARRGKWRQAEYLKHVGSKRHAGLVARCRLELLPVEMERGRWRGVARTERKCEQCGMACGDVRHMMAECQAAGGSEGEAVWEVVSGARQDVSGRQWRAAAREVERRWLLKRRFLGMGQEGEQASEEGESVADEAEAPDESEGSEDEEDQEPESEAGEADESEDETAESEEVGVEAERMSDSEGLGAAEAGASATERGAAGADARVPEYYGPGVAVRYAEPTSAEARLAAQRASWEAVAARRARVATGHRRHQ